jgi:hypothetical protein
MPQIISQIKNVRGKARDKSSKSSHPSNIRLAWVGLGFVDNRVASQKSAEDGCAAHSKHMAGDGFACASLGGVYCIIEEFSSCLSQMTRLGGVEKLFPKGRSRAPKCAKIQQKRSSEVEIEFTQY